MIMMTKKEYLETQERIRMLADIALSALALKINIELGASPPPLYALNRDLAAFERRFGGIMNDGPVAQTAQSPPPPGGDAGSNPVRSTSEGEDENAERG